MIWVVIATVLVLLGLGFAVWHRRHKMFYHFRVVEPGRLYRSGTLRLKGLRKVHKKYQIDTIINLRLEQERSKTDWYQMESAYCLEHNIQLINIPMMFNDPPNQQQIAQFLQATLPPADNRVLVHCEAGAIRTSMMVFVYLKHRFNFPNDEILRDLPFFGHSIEKDGRWQVRDFILNYQSSVNRPADCNAVLN